MKDQLGSDVSIGDYVIYHANTYDAKKRLGIGKVIAMKKKAQIDLPLGPGGKLDSIWIEQFVVVPDDYGEDLFERLNAIETDY